MNSGRSLFLSALAACLVLGAPPAAQAKKPVAPKSLTRVETDKGVVQGKAFSNGRRWLGIPFAAPPVGALRWRPPAAAARWKGVRDATRFAPACLQSDTEYDEHRGSEDCLYLNVYAPGRRPAKKGKLPVMVWLHGGGFINGSGNDFVSDKLATTANAIIVPINYRLGPFGWLALDSLSKEQGGASGDYGLMDQVAALRWVKRNISRFGGDPNNVTLFGQSAGGESVFAQTASPLAAGLFQKGISHSAPAALRLPTLKAASDRNQAAYATEVGCADPATQTACLRALPAEKALAAGHETFDLIRGLGLYWTPIVGVPSLPAQWLDRYRAGTFNKVPIMAGHTANEGRLFTAIFENNTGHRMTYPELLDRGTKFFSVATPAVLAQYATPVDPGDKTADVITDALFACGENRDRDALVANGAPAVYSFEFADDNAFDVEVAGRFRQIEDGHDADLPFLFQHNHGHIAVKQPAFSPAQKQIAIQMGEYWGNFARTGDPNGPGLPKWHRYVNGTSTPTQLLTPGGARQMPDEAYYNDHKCGFWYPLLQVQEATK